ncbi:MAG: type I-C CRISPR-associated protein Cas8c/Csd1 [Spirochaetales bacterium]|nr:type I-C CRISPR-associated protein Cas8c/Csd1 [Spirochaetales bacterium]
MILQALYDYYERMSADPANNMAPEGFEWKEIPFLIVIDREGRFVRLEDTRTLDGKKKVAKRFLVPQGEKKTSGIKANLLWDGPDYVLGANPRNRNDSAERHNAFLTRLKPILYNNKEIVAIKALSRFLYSGPLKQVLDTSGDSHEWKEILEGNLNLTFRLEGDNPITDILKDVLSNLKEYPGPRGLCLVKGEQSYISRLHPAIKGVWGAQPSGAALVSYNLPPFCSFGKEQNFNAPMSNSATFAYTTALNSLLLKGSDNRLQLGDASTVFWTQKQAARIEKQVKSFFAQPPKEKDDPNKGVADAKQQLESILTGITPEESQAGFYILGLAPNAARISVRFWHQGTVGEFAENMRIHLADLEIVAPQHDQQRMGLMYLLGATVLDWKSDNIPPNIVGNVIRAILSNAPYPESFQNQCLRRIRAEQSVPRVRAAILKACINRKLRLRNHKNEKEMTVSLDPSNSDPGYLLGRLFAVLERIQEDANPNIGATIRERFYGAASSNPVAVFPQLLKLKNHHLAKLSNKGQVINHEKRLAEIFDGLDTRMPSHLAMDEQAKFAIGYYHQRQSFFTKNVESKGDQV